ncbi:MAG TPA: hypothetical protein VMG12_14970 [Polyangiaceae bacterium]|nr:hypothetical protein [Polyangiaceae bacterium]
MTDSDAPLAGPEPPAPAAPAGARPPADGPEVLGGRLFIGVGMLISMSVIAWQGLNAVIDRTLHPKAVKPVVEWKAGNEADVELTLITPDAKRLQCAHDATIEGLHCGYTANKRPFRRVPNAPFDDNDQSVIQPYRTADTNALVLVSGLWAEPEIALRLHREPPVTGDVDKNLRFVAYCRVRFVGELEKPSLRWDTNAKWGEEPKAMVAKPLRCTLEPPNG